MKKVGIGFLAIFILIGSSYFLADQYRAELYQVAIETECENSNLERRNEKTKEHTFAYLEGPRVEGQDTIVLLHGFSANKDNWVRYSKHLSGKMHVVALDLMGHGESEIKEDEEYSLITQVEFVRKAMKHIGVEKFHIVGNSMGGAISVLYAATYPEQIKSATLISPAGVHDIPSRMDEILAEGGNPLIVKSAGDFSELLDFTMEDGPYIPDSLIKYQGEIAASRQELNAKIFSDFVNSDLGENSIEGPLEKVKIPVLFIWGEQDRAINVKNIDKYAASISNSEKLILQNIGHLAMIEAPEVSAKATLKFLKLD